MRSFFGQSWPPPCDPIWYFKAPPPPPSQIWRKQIRLIFLHCSPMWSRVSNQLTKYIHVCKSFSDQVNIGLWRYHLLNHRLITDPGSNYFLYEDLQFGQLFCMPPYVIYFCQTHLPWYNSCVISYEIIHISLGSCNSPLPWWLVVTWCKLSCWLDQPQYFIWAAHRLEKNMNTSLKSFWRRRLPIHRFLRPSGLLPVSSS